MRYSNLDGNSFIVDTSQVEILWRLFSVSLEGLSPLGAVKGIDWQLLPQEVDFTIYKL